MGLAALLDECWTLAQRKECVNKLAELASQGDMESIKLLMAYAFGKPREKQQIEHSGPNGVPFVVNLIGDGPSFTQPTVEGDSQSGE